MQEAFFMHTIFSSVIIKAAQVILYKDLQEMIISANRFGRPAAGRENDIIQPSYRFTDGNRPGR